MRWLSWIMGGCLFAAIARPACAQSEPTSSKVVVVVDEGHDALRHRLSQELESLGLVVVELSSEEKSAGTSLDDQARAVDAIAAMRVTGTSDGAVEMTVIDRATGKTVHRRLMIAEATDPAAAELISVRTIELFRASLMELSAPHPPRGDVKAPPKVAKLAQPQPVVVVPAANKSQAPVGAVAVFAGGVIKEAKGWSLGSGVQVGTALMLGRRVGLEGFLVLPVGASIRRLPSGTIHLNATGYSLGVTLVHPYRSLHFDVALGVTSEQMIFRATAGYPYYAVRETTRSFGGYSAFGVGVTLYKGLVIRFGQSLSLVTPNTVVRASRERTASYGMPVGYTSLSLKLGFQ